MSLRDQILNHDDLVHEIIDVPEWGCKLELRSPSGRVRMELIQRYMSGDVVDFPNLYPQVIIATAHDPETGERVFDNEDVSAINEKRGDVVQRIGDRAMRVSGLIESAVEEGKDDSSSNLSGDTTSDSPPVSVER